MKTDLYIINGDIYVQNNETELTLYHCKENWEIAISTQLYEIIAAFFVARTISSVIMEMTKKYCVNEKHIKDIIDNLIEKKIVVKYHEQENANINRRGMFETPVIDINLAIKREDIDVVFIGMPYDYSVTYRNGCKFATKFLREESKAVFQYRELQGVPSGMLNISTNESILDGIKMADCGDVSNIIFERNGKEFEYLKMIVSKLINQNKFLVLLGGDHSISATAIKGAAIAKKKMGVFQFDAHDDFSERMVDGWKEKCHHGNFMNWVIGEENVIKVMQIGVRQYTRNMSFDAKRNVIGVLPAREVIKKIEQICPKDLPYYITFDVDCLDLSVINSTGTLLPGGFYYREVIEILKWICLNYQIIGFDFMELIPGNNWEGIIGAAIILEVLQAAMKKKNDKL